MDLTEKNFSWITKIGCKGLDRMKRNVGGMDRVFRFAIGAAIISAGLYHKKWWGLIGIVPITTAALRRCPAYLPFGFSTFDCDKK